MKIYSKTDIGLVRKINQDNMYFKKISDNMVYAIICDGMGGANGGEVASELAVSKASEFMDSHLKEELDTEQIKNVLEETIKVANSHIYEKSLEDSNLRGMGTTIVLAVIKDNKLCISYAGDSRAYLCNAIEIRQLTVDHSIVQQMIDSGEITVEQAKKHPQKNVITRALGVWQDVKADTKIFDIDYNDKILLCTDGLSNNVSSKKMQKIILNNDIEKAADNLIQSAISAGGNDNITVIIMSN